MHHLSNSIAVVGVAVFEEETMDVCAEVRMTYDASKRELTVALDNFLRHPDPSNVKQRVQAAWLLEALTVRESVSPEESGDLARNIARSWRKSVFERVPGRVFR